MVLADLWLASWLFCVAIVLQTYEAAAGTNGEDDRIEIGELYDGRNVPAQWVSITRSKSARQPVRRANIAGGKRRRRQLWLLWLFYLSNSRAATKVTA